MTEVLQILEPLLGMATAKAILGELIEDELKDSLKDRLDFLVKKIRGNTSVGQYYKNAIQKIYREKDSDLVGEDALSHDDIYMDAYSTDNKFPNKKILSIIQDWSHEAPSGVMLIHGEPGHGKTTLCRKAVCEHTFKKFCPDKTNVFWFRLNPAFAEDIIENGKFVLKNAFCWGNPAGKFGEIPLEENEKEYQNSVIFLDGYDELKAQLHGVNKDLQDFITTAKQMAQDYDMHIVITTRTRSLSDERRLNIPSLQFAPISEYEQDAWIEKNAPDYKEAFEGLRESSEEMEEMLGIPILFRMVVKEKLESTAAQNVVGLYDTLFEATMKRRKMASESREDWHKKYEQLAYEIYCNDDTFADVQKMDMPEEFLYMFHLKGEGKQHVEFLHRSFYQYFLAHFLYRKMSEIKDGASAEAFLCCLAERRIDDDVLNYIEQLQEKKPDVTQEKCEQIIKTLEQNGTIIEHALKVPNEDGNAEKNPLLRCENVLTNALSICCVVAANKESKFIISLRYKENLHASMQRYNCSKIWLENIVLRRAFLSGIDLAGTNLSGANLSEVNLSRADLRLANLRLANLRLANLSRVDLTGANLSGADLRGAGNLHECNCRRVLDWMACKILLRDRDKLGLDDPDAHGIIWCDDETGDPIKP